jgi:hypothetical protein
MMLPVSTVLWDEVRRDAQMGDSSIEFTVRPADPTEVDAAAEAIALAWEAFQPTSTPVHLHNSRLETSPIDVTWLIYIGDDRSRGTQATRWASLEALLTLAVRYLHDADIAVTIGPPEFPDDPPATPGVETFPTAILAFDGWTPLSKIEPRGLHVSPVWDNDPEARTFLTDWVSTWVQDDRTNPVWFYAPRRRRMLDPADLPRFLAHHPTQRRVTSATDGNRFRRVAFDPTGRLCLTDFDANLPTSKRQHALRQALIDHAPHLDFATIRRTATAWTANDALKFWLSLPPYHHTHNGYYASRRDLDTTQVPDAAGIQLLTDHHLANAHDLSNWNITTVAPGKHLVEAPDLDPWYAEDAPDPDTIAQARIDFGAMILGTPGTYTDPAWLERAERYAHRQARRRTSPTTPPA